MCVPIFLLVNRAEIHCEERQLDVTRNKVYQHVKYLSAPHLVEAQITCGLLPVQGTDLPYDLKITTAVAKQGGKIVKQ